jgi:LPXTG-site transpeptidase (sortase) family protein
VNYKTHKKRYAIVGIIICIAFVILIAWLYFSSGKHDTPSVNKTSDDGVIRYSTDNPSEERPDSNYAWLGSAKDPKKVKLPTINVDAYIQKVGIDQKGRVAVPNNLFVAGWFVDTVRPGDNGLSIIDGHVTGRRNDGIFKDLEKLKQGDIFTVELGDGSLIKYEVIGIESVGVDTSESVIFSQNPTVMSQLNLVTCSGVFDEKSRTYNERLIVSSKKL